MKRHTLAVAVLIAAVTSFAVGQAQPFSPSQSESQVAGIYYASAYSTWSASIVSGNSATGSGQSITVSAPSILANGTFLPITAAFNAVTLGSITTGDGSNSETVTPTGISIGNCPGPYSPATQCATITGTFNNLHYASANGTVKSATLGLNDALSLAASSGTGSTVVVIDNAWASLGGTSAIVTALTSPYSNVTIVDNRGPAVSPAPYWTAQPSTLTALAIPATRSATAGATQVVSGTAVGTWTAAATYVAVTCLDILGGESPASATYNFTATANVALNFAAPAAQTGCVGWRPYAGASYATAYQLPVTSANCTLTPLENVIPACAITNTVYGQVGSAGVFPTPTTHTQIPPQSGGVAAAYNPNTTSHTTFAYQPTSHVSYGFQTSFGPFVATPALTAGQLGVVGTVALPAGFFNYIYRKVRLEFDVTSTPSTGGTAQGIDVEIGDLTDFTTGTPLIVCIGNGDITASGTAAVTFHEVCTLTANATGTTGSLKPGGFGIEQVAAQGTIGNAFSIPPTLVTADVFDQDSLFFVYLQTSGAESTTPPQMQNLQIDIVN